MIDLRWIRGALSRDLATGCGIPRPGRRPQPGGKPAIRNLPPVIGASVLLALVAGCARQQAPAPPPGPMMPAGSAKAPSLVGKPAPNFTLPATVGGKFTLAAHGKAHTLLYFYRGRY